VANPEQMLQQIQKMQADMAAAQEALANETVEASAGGGVVKAVVNGHGDLLRMTIDASVVDPDDIETLEDLVVAVVTEAVRQSRELQQKRMGAATGGIGGGDVDDLFGRLLG
jgi:nucleoid-associated protein EbfC